MEYLVIFILAFYLFAFSIAMRKMSKKRKMLEPNNKIVDATYDYQLLNEIQGLYVELNELKRQVSGISAELIRLKSSKRDDISLSWHCGDLEPLMFEKKRKVYEEVWTNPSTFFVEGVNEGCRQ